MKKHNKSLRYVLVMLLTVLSLCIAVSAADDLVFEFKDEATFGGWSADYLRFNFEPGYFNGYAYEKSANLSDPMLISPSLNINAEDYRYIIVEMKYSMDATWQRTGHIFFTTPGGNFNADNIVSSPSYKNFTEYDFIKVVYDMTTSENWTGTIDRIRLDPFETPGSVCVKSLTITNDLPVVEEKPEEKPEQKPTEDPNAKKTGVFLKPNTYTGSFVDVPQNEWYAKEVAAAYELGLINGKSATSFDPNGNMTIAEAVTIAARTNNAYGTADYDFTAAAGEEWYTPYVRYAINKGIIKENTFSDYNALITRGQMALVFANVLPSSEYAYINSVSAIRDVPQTSSYFNAVYKLYNAGIVMGSDGYGTFNPDDTIIRCEAAAIINRVAIKENRLSKNLANAVLSLDNRAFAMTSEAKFFIDDEKFRHTHMDGVPGGWDVVKTYDSPSGESRPFYNLVDNSSENEMYFTRKFMEVNDGVLDFQLGARAYGRNGVFFAFVDKNGKSVAEVLLDNSNYYVLAADGSYQATGLVYTSSTMHMGFHINLDTDTFDLSVNGTYGGTYPLASANGICEVRYGVTKAGYLTATADYATLTHNYLLLERFANAPNNVLPYDVKTISDGGKVDKVNTYPEYSGGGTVALKSKANGRTGIAGDFESASGNVVFESYVFLPTVLDGAKVALTSAGNEVFALTTKNGAFTAPDGSVVKNVVQNLWTIVRFEADTATGKALVKINGKNVGTYAFTAPSAVIDGYEITYTPASEAVMYVDDLTAFIKLPYPADYVPEPVIPESDYLVGLNVCSLWREGVHYGWEEITAYPEITSVLGYYDEGSPEVSDWEIKMMTEHGIDYQIFCWYPDGNNTKPIQRSGMNQALIDGYFNARYSDKMKFAIMWENSSVNGMTFENFKKHTVPYWMEYFFKDDRYLKIDNKPLFTIWSLNGKFADVSAKEAMDYLREACIKEGFDGCEIMLYTSNTDPSYKETLDSLGVDGILGYHWGTDGANGEKQAKSLTAYSALDYTIPTISVGFDYVGWGMSKQRNGLLDPAEYPALTEIVKKALAKRQANGDKYANMVNISTWNEYGEGTYVMPTQRHGFAYLDAIRKAFTKDNTPHKDLTPTSKQRQRINYMFDQNRQLLRPQLLEKTAVEEKNPYEEAVSVRKITFENDSVANWGAHNVTSMSIENGIFHIVPASKDPAIFSKQFFAEPVSTKESNVIRIRAKINGSGKSVMNVFFRTDDGSDFSGDKVCTQSLVPNEWHDYYFDFRSNENWKGKIVNLRLDPAEYQCDLAEVESIEFLYVPETTVQGPFTVDIIGAKLDLIQPADLSSGGLMVPLYPESGMLARMMSTYTWNKNTKELVITNGKHTFSNVIGTDVATVDGVTQTLYAKTYMFDGLPIVPLDTIATALGYYPVYHEDGNGVSIMLDSAEDYEIIASREPGKYEFNLDGDLEDWTWQNSSVIVKNGALCGTATNGDPAVISPTLKLDAEMYPEIVVRMKWDRDNKEKELDTASIYFKTVRTGLSESRRVGTPLPASSNGEFVEVRFSMKDHLQWYGDIVGIRLDPFNATGTYEIDYIRFEVDQNVLLGEKYMAEREANLDDTIANGDASITSFNPMFSDNAVITIVPSDINGYCYQVKAVGGKTWTYCSQRVKFTPGATYVVEFDARMLSTTDGKQNAGLETDIIVNFMYNGAEKRDHTRGAGKLIKNDCWEWTHYTAELTVDESCDNTSDVVGIYTNPIGNVGVSYELDNLTITKK